MLFNSVQFLVFFAAVFVVYWHLPRRGQNLFLLAASYLFYGAWNWKFLGLILTTTVADYAAALIIANNPHRPMRRRVALASALAVNLGILGFFKYYNFFVEDVVGLVQLLGMDYLAPVLPIVLPVGISFYTFQSMSYTLDTWHGRLKPTPRFTDYALFVSFFPQLVAGPIERAPHLLGQIERPRAPRREQMGEGLLLLCLGLFKKVAVADHLGQFVDTALGQQTGWKLLIALYFFSFQIYCDFSGYSDIARGAARLLGFDLRTNFNRPYFARSLTEFWRRWHISLSTWFRDYVYTPLGGRHAPGYWPYANLMIVFLLSGLWHGAAFTFLIWGALHGGLLAAEKALAGWRKGHHEPPHGLNPRNLVAVFVTFHVVTAAWVFFRAPDLPFALDVFARLAAPADRPLAGLMPLAHGLGGLALLLLWEGFEDGWRRWLANPWRALPAACAVLLFTLLWGKLNGGQFIYFQF
ncbi:MBOAT family O-acyltransferase [Roseospirillum parvum]|uniref:Probable alginate O-acetylase AlgI n=1 Tax=Roseospirillum parvum TaxID=83401 RepID=A0A1G8E4J6_9PROT|nr:MBOAT family O-acyltransferase [Roseospirillum parvum]SDH64868.1 D-alanyl-lipoteichoic acid acyltransferase DltB, MBOAT superfamily [Roseospirillum parvum]